MDNIKLYTVLVVLLAIATLLVAQPWIEAVRHRPGLIEKHGRVVDARSGAPIATAVVVFHWLHERRNVDCSAERATTTDAEGAFVLPDVSSDVTFDRSWLVALLGTITMFGSYPARYHYTLAAYAPGFALTGPTRAGGGPLTLTYELTDPSGEEEHGVVDLGTIKLVRTSFSPTDEISYLARLKETLRCGSPGQSGPSAVASVRAEIVEQIRPLRCEMSDTTTMSAELISEYVLAANDRKVTEALRPLTRAWDHLRGKGTCPRALYVELLEVSCSSSRWVPMWGARTRTHRSSESPRPPPRPPRV